jgi:hypothetical protein
MTYAPDMVKMGGHRPNKVDSSSDGQEACLCRVGHDRNDDLVVVASCSLDDGEVTDVDRIERAGIQSHAHVMSLAERAHCREVALVCRLGPDPRQLDGITRW